MNALGLVIITPHRGNDNAGNGDFGSSRVNGRKHLGEDILVIPESSILAITSGVVTRLGYAYTGAHYRYVEITPSEFYAIRYFYVQPRVFEGQIIKAGDIIGLAQDITARYPDQGMRPHIHIEVIDRKTNQRVDPKIHLGEFTNEHDI